MNMKTNNKSGFTLVEIMIVVAIIGLVAAIAVPNFVRARTLSRKNTCIANLRQIENAKLVWANEEKKSGHDIPQKDDLFGTAKYPAFGTALSSRRRLCPDGSGHAH